MTVHWQSISSFNKRLVGKAIGWALSLKQTWAPLIFVLIISLLRNCEHNPGERVMHSFHSMFSLGYVLIAI